MDITWDLTLAIASDLHCHEESVSPAESWLIAGARRKPAGNHPIQSLISLITESKIRADAVICPGDLANRVSSQGMIQAWDHLRELERELKASLLITTIGNHDVDYYKKYNSDPFDIPRNLHEAFPVASQTDLASFWANGFYFASGPNGSEFLVLNTVIGHNDGPSAKRGTFDHDRIKNLGAALSEKDRTLGRSNIIRRIAVMHHHPLLHSSSRFSSSDVLEFGDQLLNLLNQHGYRFIIHGHRHDPRITRQSFGQQDYFVFAAGSFSAILKELSTWTRNLFHIVKLRYNQSNGQLLGELLTWEYNKGMGWRQSTAISASLPHVSRFCAPRPALNLADLVQACDNAAGSILRSHELKSRFPETELLLPQELSDLKISLEKLGLRLIVAPDGTIDYIGRPHVISP